VLLSGILERHPKLKVVFAEAGTGWIPYMLDRIDYEWENSHAEWQTICKTQPSELFRRQVFATFQIVVSAYATHRAWRAGSAPACGPLVSADCARNRMHRAAFTSASSR
jgi:hypothetical protein